MPDDSGADHGGDLLVRWEVDATRWIRSERITIDSVAINEQSRRRVFALDFLHYRCCADPSQRHLQGVSDSTD